MQSTGQGAIQSSQPVHCDRDHRVHESRGADDRIDRARRKTAGATVQRVSSIQATWRGLVMP
jgi:hypothetical protein